MIAETIGLRSSIIVSLYSADVVLLTITVADVTVAVSIAVSVHGCDDNVIPVSSSFLVNSMVQQM